MSEDAAPYVLLFESFAAFINFTLAVTGVMILCAVLIFIVDALFGIPDPGGRDDNGGAGGASDG